jgi:hypothetical protein
MRFSRAVVLIGLLAVSALVHAERPVTPADPEALRARIQRDVDPYGRVGYLKKRFVGGPFQIFPEAVLAEDLDGTPGAPGNRRAFVVLGPQGYTWRFRYDLAAGIPRYRHIIGGARGADVLEIDAPEALAFVPAVDISLTDSLICTNVRTCNIPGCNCCILCYCGGDGTYCDYDDTGFYNRFERVEATHEVRLR